MTRFKKSQLVMIRDPSSKKQSFIPATILDNKNQYQVQYLDRHSQSQLTQLTSDEIHPFHDQSEEILSGTTIYAPWYDTQRKLFCYPLYEAVLQQNYDKTQPSRLVRLKFKGERRETFVDVKWIAKIQQ